MGLDKSVKTAEAIVIEIKPTSLSHVCEYGIHRLPIEDRVYIFRIPACADMTTVSTKAIYEWVQLARLWLYLIA